MAQEAKRPLLSEEKKRASLGEVERIFLPSTTVNHWDQIQKFRFKDDDLLICTYPKSGTTWIQEIVDMIEQKGDVEKCRRSVIHHRHPFIEWARSLQPSGVDQANAMPSPRVLKTHLATQLLPPSFWESACKIIYVARNPKDCMVSYYHFQRMSQTLPEPGTWEDYFENFMNGKESHSWKTLPHHSSCW